MQQVRSRRELYSEATRAALLDEATRLFATRGYAGTSLEDVAAASQVTRGAVYHHFDGKQALFEAVLDAQEMRAIAEITAAATAADPLDAALQALDAFLDQCCDPVYGRLVWLEGPTALGWHRWRECEQKYAYGLVERFITALVDAGYLADRALGSLVRFSFWMLGGAGLALAEAPEADKPRLREEWRYLIRRTISGLRAVLGRRRSRGHRQCSNPRKELPLSNRTHGRSAGTALNTRHVTCTSCVPVKDAAPAEVPRASPAGDPG